MDSQIRSILVAFLGQPEPLRFVASVGGLRRPIRQLQLFAIERSAAIATIESVLGWPCLFQKRLCHAKSKLAA